MEQQGLAPLRGLKRRLAPVRYCTIQESRPYSREQHTVAKICAAESIQIDSIGMARHIRDATSRSFPPTFGSRFRMFWTGGPATSQERENETLHSRA